MILSWSERMISHTGTETRPRRFRAAAVRNFGQWAKAWSSYIAWMKKAQLVVKFIFSLKIMTSMKWIVPANSVPAAAVIRGGQALFEMIGRKEHVDGFLSGHIVYERVYTWHYLVMWRVEYCSCMYVRMYLCLYLHLYIYRRHIWQKDQGSTMVLASKLRN